MIQSAASSERQPAPKLAADGELVTALENAYSELQRCIVQLLEVLDQSELDRSRLTTVRLKLAQLRLSRGPLIARVAAQVAGKISASEAALLQEIRTGHDHMLREASVHTGKWTLDAIAANWTEYRSATRQIARSCMEWVNREQELLYPLLSKTRAVD